ncbi:MAG: S8 family serine peptidase [Anaerolineales bacterium]
MKRFLTRSLVPAVLNIALVFAVLLPQAGGHQAAPSPRLPKMVQRDPQARVDQAVLEDTADGKTAEFLVILKPQADARQIAAQATTWDEKGGRIFEALRRTAEVSQSAVITQLKALGARYDHFYIINALLVKGDRAVVEAMLQRPDVLAVENNRPFRVPLEAAQAFAPVSPAAVEWNLGWVKAPQVWDLGYTGQGMVLANADTGVKWDHPALQAHYRGWDGQTADHNYNWWDAVHEDIDGSEDNLRCGFNSAVPCDDNGHGTHTMGIAVGDDGGENKIGMAPGAKWISCRNMDDGWGKPSTYIECMQFFLAPWDLNQQNPDPSLRPHAVGNSFSCPPEEGCSPHSLQAAIENLRSAGVFMAVSAGNRGPDCSTVSEPPALEDAAITVGATGEQSNSIATLSSRGPVSVDGSYRRKPDLVAPGIRVRSSYPGGYASLSGTSMASPHVSGAVALLWSAFPDLRRDVEQTEMVLKRSALHLTSDQGCGGDSGIQTPNNVYGYGLLDVLAAYHSVENPPVSLFYYFPSILVGQAVSLSAGHSR